MPKKMTDAILRGVIEQSIQDSTYFDDSESQDNYRRAMDSYYGRNKPKTTDGRSGAVSNDVADMVEAVVSQMMPAFDFAELAHFSPIGTVDFDQAAIESAVCNDHLQDENEGYTKLQEALRNALLLRNGILKIWPEAKQTVERKTYKNVNAIEFDNIMQPTSPEQQTDITGEIEDNGDETINFSIKRTTFFRRLAIDSTDPIEFFITKNWTSINLADVPLAGEHYFLSGSDLRDLGIPQKTIDSMASTDTSTRPAQSSRNRAAATQNLPAPNGDPSRRMFECFELYILIDYDGDGFSERRKILYGGGVSGGTVLVNEPWIGVPYASGTGFLQPQRWLGMSLYDKLKDLEDQKTEALRQYLDNLDYANNKELLVNDMLANMDDLKARRPGGLNRVDDVNNAAREVEFSNIGAESQAFLNYMDQVRSERGGASLDLQAAELQLAGETAHGIERQYTSKEQLSQLMTRTLCETLLRQTFLLIHETLRRDFPQSAQLPIGGDLVSYEPGTWQFRKRLTITAGLTAGERRDRRVALEGVLAQQEKLNSMGFGNGILVDLPTYQNTLLDWTAAGGVSNPRRYWLDPRSNASMQAQQQAQLQAQQAQEQERLLGERIFQTQVGIENNKNEKDIIIQAAKTQFDYWQGALTSATNEQQFQLQFGGNLADPEKVDRLQDKGEVKAAGLV